MFLSLSILDTYSVKYSDWRAAPYSGKIIYHEMKITVRFPSFILVLFSAKNVAVVNQFYPN